MKFRIKTVDMYGHLGRDNHPAETDVGLEVQPLFMEAMFAKPGEFGPIIQQRSANGGFLDADALPYLFNEQSDDAHFVEICYTCVTRDGRLLDLMDFELESIA